MDKVLLSCPSRQRPDRLKEMLSSYAKTRSDGTDLVIYIDRDEPLICDYEALIIPEGARLEIHERTYLAHIHNNIINNNSGYDFYMPVNDDIIFRTQGWDKILVSTIKEKGAGWGIAYGNDLAGNYKYELPTFGMVSANIIRILGYVYPPEVYALFGDTFLLDLGRAIGRIFYNPDVIIEHIRQLDYMNDYRASLDFDKRDRKAYAGYFDSGNFDRDVDKIFEGIIRECSKLVPDLALLGDSLEITRLR